MRGDTLQKIFAAFTLLLVVGGATWFRLRDHRSSVGEPAVPGANGLSVQELASRLGTLEAKERETDQTVWAKERKAEQYGLVFEQLWDLINVATNKLDALRAFSFGDLTAANYPSAKKLGHDIELFEPSASVSTWTSETWRQFLEERQRDGWQLSQVEFRHNHFETGPGDQRTKSTFYFAAHLTNPARVERAILEGDLIVEWATASGGGLQAPVRLTDPNTLGPSREGNFVAPALKGSPPTEGPEVGSVGADQTAPFVKRIDASHLKIKTRRGQPAFQPILVEEVMPAIGSYFIDPLIVYDLDGDGRSEIILAAKNLLFRQRDGERFESEPLCRHSPGLIFTGIIADFDGDGFADFLCAKFEGLILFHGSPRGRFDEPGRLVWEAHPHLKYGQVMTCGDIDGDGDLDVWLGQYKVPYERGQMPTPYFDANDGHPSYLLINDGKGNFSDATVAAGLEQKRWRRCYSASLVDLDHDGDLDLMVVSDFAGIDLYENDGRGHFRDVTRDWLAESHGFGMAHAVADFDADGRLDLLMIGMNSPTADRLESLGLRRTVGAPENAARPTMSFGNRLYLAREGKPKFQQTPLNNSLAPTGWSWGCSGFDFDNDGFPDVYIANGHETRQTVREYEPEFWLHDIYVADSKESVVATAYFGGKFARTRGRGFSYGGYEKNRFFWNQRGESFIEIGHLMDVALEADSRNVVAEDLDGDGRVDLLVTTFEVWPKTRQTLRVFKNKLNDAGNWIGFRLREQGGGISPVGAQVTVRHAGGAMTRQIITGDSYRSQHSNTVHFGLGSIGQVESVEVRWTNGQTLTLRQPEINRYHDVAWRPAPPNR